MTRKQYRRPRPEAALIDWVDVAFIGGVLFVAGLAFTIFTIAEGYEDPPTDTMFTGIVLVLTSLFRAVFIRDTDNHAREHVPLPMEDDDGR